MLRWFVRSGANDRAGGQGSEMMRGATAPQHDFAWGATWDLMIRQMFHFNLAPPQSSLDEITIGPKLVSLTDFIE
jgi:hypothetical protein